MENKIQLLQYDGEKNYDSEFCGSIPLHQINLIQPHGFLLVLDKALHIRQVSENSTQLLGITPDNLVNKPFSDFLTPGQLTDFSEKLQQQEMQLREGQEQPHIPFMLTLETDKGPKVFTANVYPRQDMVLIELEPDQSGEEETFLSFFQQIKYITARIKQAEGEAAIAQTVAEEFKRLTGFDRVLVYRFDPSWNGTVVGQAKTEEMSDLLGLRFPASDVPKQARDLYFKNPYRLIPARDYEPVRFYPVLNPITRRFTDMTSCNLRSVASVHLEYMANMGISASMSVPLIIEDKLWGLISCHHVTSKYPSYQQRTAMELLASIASVRLAAHEKEQAAKAQANLRGLHSRLLEQLFNHEFFAQALLEGEPSLLELLQLDGAAVVYEGQILKKGTTPPDAKIKEIVSWLHRNRPNQTFVTNSLPKVYTNSKEYKDEASGLLALPINSELGEYMLCFRREVLHTVNWSGNPDQAIRMEPDGKGYHPRNSFALYQQTVEHTSLPWQPEELAAADALRSAVLGKIIRERN